MIPAVAVALTLCVIMLAVIDAAAARAVRRAEAQTAADLAALAGVFEGESGAAELARLNGAELVAFEASGGRVAVVVAVGEVRASAVAELSWDSVDSSPP